MPDELTDGQYTIADDLTSLIIHSARSVVSGEMGRYYKNDSFRVYQVFPEAGGIVWGRVSENTTGALRFVGMRVNNHLKVAKIENQPAPTGVEARLLSLEARVTALEKGKPPF